MVEIVRYIIIALLLAMWFFVTFILAISIVGLLVIFIMIEEWVDIPRKLIDKL